MKTLGTNLVFFFLMSLLAMGLPSATYAQDDDADATADSDDNSANNTANTVNAFLGAINSGLKQNPSAQTAKMQKLERNIDRAERDIKRIQQLNDAMQTQPQCAGDSC